MKRENREAKLWPVGTEVVLVDAWGFNPVDVKVTRHFENAVTILCEDARGVVYFSETWRIQTDPQNITYGFEELLG